VSYSVFTLIIFFNDLSFWSIVN